MIFPRFVDKKYTLDSHCYFSLIYCVLRDLEPHNQKSVELNRIVNTGVYMASSIAPGADMRSHKKLIRGCSSKDTPTSQWLLCKDLLDPSSIIYHNPLTDFPQVCNNSIQSQ